MEENGYNFTILIDFHYLASVYDVVEGVEKHCNYFIIELYSPSLEISVASMEGKNKSGSAIPLITRTTKTVYFCRYV